jgi:MinD-like ATPase involved in chromosome partitioning or flagellar assembly
VREPGDARGQPLWFVVLDEDGAWREALADMFAAGDDLRMAGGTGHAADVERLVRDNGADIVLVDHALARRSGLAVAADLARRLPSVRVYLTSHAPSRPLWEEARRRGLRGIVPKPFDRPALAARIREDEDLDQRVAASLAAARGGAPEANVIPGGAGDEPGAPRLGGVGDPPRTLAVCSFKGGVGKSLISVNLAVAAGSPTARHRRAVALVDAEEGVGSTAALLGVVPHPTIEDWAEYRGERCVDPVIAAQKLAQTRLGLSCVFAPGALDRSVDGDVMETVLATLPRMFGLTVVDCAPAVTPAVLVALRAATTVLVVVEPTLDCLDRTRKGAAALAAAGLPTGKLRVLCNQNRPGPGDFSPVEVREALGLQVLGSLPFDVGAKRSCNRRRPLACVAPRGPFMRSLCRVVGGLLPGVGEAPPGRVWWRA